MQVLTLKNGVDLEAAPPITYKNDMVKTRIIAFKTYMPYSELFTLLSNYDNVSEITYRLLSGTAIDTIVDCVKLKSLSANVDTGVYTAEFSTDATEKMILELQGRMELLELENQELQQAVNALIGREEPVEGDAESEEQEEAEAEYPEGTDPDEDIGENEE